MLRIQYVMVCLMSMVGHELGVAYPCNDAGDGPSDEANLNICEPEIFDSISYACDLKMGGALGIPWEDADLTGHIFENNFLQPF